ncbi:disease resistance protein RPV1-like isoform X6 [Diospyros lotus]|uniref:disease resistance protein RPV1-like isoform X6 n=1 Tax=Diospyros lotus TaxID=55363 RepID=UPI002254ED4A|nr:disease resistance protein RPV1-like isoform X6 [Diospyros lotus]
MAAAAASWGATQEVSSSLYPNPISPPQKYDVFLSFSGSDTRKRFTSHLLASMERNRFRTFRDDKELERGEDIGAGLMKAIEESRVSLVVLSKSYAMSRWCLDELVKIMDCKKKKKFQHTVIPIFYEIEPSEVRHQNGSIAEALDKHMVLSSRMEKWKAALTDVAQLSGFVLQSMVDRDEASFVKLIVEEIERQLNPTMRLHVADHSVGMIPRLQKLLKLLSMESSNDVRIVAIWGIGGLGKTTIAKAAYNHISCQFEGSSFVAEIMMHDLLRNMGKEIVRQESIKDTSKRSRLWDHEDVLEMLRHDEGTEAIEGLILSPSEAKDVKVNAEAFKKMNKLRVLHLDHVHLGSGYEHLSKRLVWLRWHGFCLKFVPSQLCMETLVALDLSHSMIRQVWKGTKTLGKLKFLYLSHCYYLTTTPDFSALSNIEELFLNNCIRLLEVDESIRYLRKLVVLNLASCKNLRKLPSGSWMLNAKILNLSGCSKLEHFTEFQELRSKSRCALLSSLALRTKSMGSVFLSMNSVQGLRCLKLLRVANCNLSYIPAEIGKLIHLECLDLVGNNFCSLPESISNLTNLMHFNLSYCERLRSLPRLSAGIRVLEVQNCTSLESISLESDWQDTDMFFNNCPKLAHTHYAHDLERSLLMSMKSGSLSISLSGDMFLNWLEYQNAGPHISFVVPPHMHQNLIGWIFCAVYTIEEYLWGIGCTIHNKTKGIQIGHDQYVSVKLVDGIHSGDMTMLGYVSFSLKGIDIQRGDEVEISLHKVMVKKSGIHPLYKADV